MILDGVDVFVKVVQAGGFSAAARQLGMPTTTVSAKIARLEERLGVTLIQRSTRRMHVTPAGEAYYARCLEAVQALEAGEEQLAAASAEPSGLLRITVASDMAQSIMPPIIEKYLKRYPRTSIDLIVTNTQVDLLAEGIDLALRAGPMKDSTLQSRKFGAAQMALFASKGYLKTHGTPRTPAELGDHEIMVHTRFPRPLVMTSADNDRFELTPTTRLKADDMQTLRALAAEGTAIALLPDLPNDFSSRLVRVLPDCAIRTGDAYFVYPAGRFTPVNVRAFVDMALEIVKGSGRA